MDYRTRLFMVAAVIGLGLSKEEAVETICKTGQKLAKFKTTMGEDKRTFEFKCEDMHMKEKIKNPKCEYQTEAIACKTIEGCPQGSWLAGYGEVDIGVKTPILVSYCCKDKAVKIQDCVMRKRPVAKKGESGEQPLENNKVYQGQRCVIKPDEPKPKPDKPEPIEDIIFKQEACSYSVGGEKAPEKAEKADKAEKAKEKTKETKTKEKPKEGKENDAKKDVKKDKKGSVKELGPCKKDAHCGKGARCTTNSNKKGSCVCRYGNRCANTRRKRYVDTD